MDVNTICEELSAMLSDIVVRPEEAVRRWSNVECKSYQLPLALITHFLVHAVPPVSRDHLPIRNRAEFLAAVDIVRNSSLHTILEHDPADNSIKYRESVPNATKEAIAKHISAIEAHLVIAPRGE